MAQSSTNRISESGPRANENEAHDDSMTGTTVRFWGVRGSIPVPGPGTVKYGGNTACVEVRSDGQIIILDAGTGIRPLGKSLMERAGIRPLTVTLLISHTHSDHIQGFPFFEPAYIALNRIKVMGNVQAGYRLEDAFTQMMDPAFFPVGLSHMQAEISFEQLTYGPFSIGSVRVSSCRTNHPGACSAFRLDTKDGSICYVTDHESGDANSTRDEAIHALTTNADVLILDSQYTAEEYPHRREWGHSSMPAAIRCARNADARRVVLFHHDPSHDDEFLDRMAKDALQNPKGHPMEISLASEGMEIRLSAACR